MKELEQKAKEFLQREGIYATEFVREYEPRYELNQNNLIKLITGFAKSVQTTNKEIQEYASFCVRCDREGMPLLEFEDYLNLELKDKNELK